MEMIKKLFIPKTWLLLLVISVLSARCKKDNISDPFGGLNNQLVCKINGSEWKSNENRYSGFYDLNPYSNLRYLYLTYRNGNQVIQLFINSPYQTGKIILNQNTNIYPNITNPKNYAAFINEYPDLTPDDLYVTNAIDVGEINFITMDTNNKKIKAKFSFTGKDNRTGKKITITDGYFEYHQ